MQQGSPVLGGGVVVHTGERGRAPGAVRLLLHAPLVGITDPDVRDLHPWGRPDPVGGTTGIVSSTDQPREANKEGERK